jgi:hypothetical protein
LWNEFSEQLRDAFDGNVGAFEAALAAYDFAAAHALLQQTVEDLDADA